jgi:hypothetical protein
MNLRELRVEDAKCANPGACGPAAARKRSGEETGFLGFSAVGVVFGIGEDFVVVGVALVIVGGASLRWIFSRDDRRQPKAARQENQMGTALDSTGGAPLSTPQKESSPSPLPSSFDKVDLSLIRYLADGRPGGYQTEINRFLEALDAAEARLRAAAESTELKRVGDAAHAMLSQGRMVSHSGAIAAAQKLEAATCEGRSGDIAGLVRAMLEETRRLREALEAARSASLAD